MHTGDGGYLVGSAEAVDDCACRFHSRYLYRISKHSASIFVSNIETEMNFESRYIKRMKDWVISAMEHADMSQADLVREMAANYGWSDNRSIVNKIVKGERDLKADEMIDISRATGYPIPSTKPPRQDGLRRVTVAAHVQAGDWAEAWEWEDADRYDVYVQDLPELRGFRLYAAEARGPSMNKRYPEKTVLVFTNVQETMESPIAGKRYIVERKKSGGEAEHTVKTLMVDADGKFWLVPESDDPRFQAPISVEDGTGDDGTVSIIGRVWFAVSRE